MVDWKDMLYCELIHPFSDWFESGENVVLLQFSGLHDKNGKEIYEGDVIKIESKLMKDNPDYKFIREVRFGKGQIFGSEWDHTIIGFWLYPCETSKEIYLSDEDADIEVLGNIYANPELLEG